MTKKKYELTPEHRAQLEPWAQRWIANAMSTAPMMETDREAMRVAVRGLYRAAKLEPPPDARIVFVPSPFVLRFAGGFAAGLWHLSNKCPTRDATSDATRAATMDATETATWAATLAGTRDATTDATWAATEAATWDATLAGTGNATRAATMAATGDATGDATSDATGNATWDATWDATRAATWDATSDATRAATRDAFNPTLSDWFSGISPADMRSIAAAFAPANVTFLLDCASHAYNMWDGGNQWSGAPAFLSFFRHVAHLDLEYSKWQHYEAAAQHGGPRIMHEKFCMVSDRPVRLMVDAQNRPHCEDGPFCAWRDGTALWAWHGTRVPAWLILHPERLTVGQIQQEANAEVRRVMLERYGFERFFADSGATPISADAFGTLYRVELEGDEPLVMVKVRNSTPEADGSFKHYMLRVPPTMPTAHDAVAWSFGMMPAEYAPQVET